MLEEGAQLTSVPDFVDVQKISGPCVSDLPDIFEGGHLTRPSDVHSS